MLVGKVLNNLFWIMAGHCRGSYLRSQKMLYINKKKKLNAIYQKVFNIVDQKCKWVYLMLGQEFNVYVYKTM